MSYELFCAIIGDKDGFPVKFDGTQTVGSLKDAIKAKAAQTLASVDAHALTLYKVNIDISNKKISARVKEQICQSSIDFDREQKLDPVDDLSDYWGESDLPKKKTIHILVELPAGESIGSIDPRSGASLRQAPFPHLSHSQQAPTDSIHSETGHGCTERCR
jgi:hypothetical protein